MDPIQGLQDHALGCRQRKPLRHQGCPILHFLNRTLKSTPPKKKQQTKQKQTVFGTRMEQMKSGTELARWVLVALVWGELTWSPWTQSLGLERAC